PTAATTRLGRFATKVLVDPPSGADFQLAKTADFEMSTDGPQSHRVTPWRTRWHTEPSWQTRWSVRLWRASRWHKLPGLSARFRNAALICGIRLSAVVIQPRLTRLQL